MSTKAKRSARKKQTPPAPAPEYDTPWKIALEQHFHAFMAFYFPKAYAQIDWHHPHQFMDKELQAITKDALVGTRHVDKLVKVRLLSGAEEWLYIHLEIQMSRQPHFAKRIFVYNYRLFDRYDQPVASMALLGDDDPKWLPRQFGYAAMDCGMAFHFPVAKLAQYIGQEAALEADPNPFALLTLAFLQNRATATDMAARYEIKCRLVRLLYAHQWSKTLIRQFFLVIDWMVALPPELEVKLSGFITEIEEGQKMEYVSSVERVLLAKEKAKGKQEAMQEAMQTISSMLRRQLTKRFGNLPENIAGRIKNASKEQIETWFDRGMEAATLDEVFQDPAH